MMANAMQTKLQPEKKRVVTSFEIGDLKDPWKAYCDTHGVTSGEALCEVIRKLTGASTQDKPLRSKRGGEGGQASRPVVLYSHSPKPEVGKRDRLYLRLNPSERLAVDARAKADGFSHATKWAVALIRARLTDQPQFGDREIDILGESNHQLLAIGRNLNQIARALNVSKGKSTIEYDAALVDSLAKALKKHVQKVGDALRASIHRWRLD